MALYRPLGCCSSGPAGFGDDGDADVAALLARRQAAQAAETTVSVDSPTDPPPANAFPWWKLLAVSITAGLTLHHLTKKGR